ncbi:MAG: hypothetical protein U0414_34050 [Polyangiaceae bacterium]
MSPLHQARRRELALAMRRAVIREGAVCSLHDLAREADVSIPTIKHYFQDRSGALAAALREVPAEAHAYVASVADPGDMDLATSLTALATRLAHAWVAFGVGRLFTAGMSAGMHDRVAGPGYLEGVLEPTVRALEERLRVHARRGEADLDPADELDVRTAALAFLSPLLVALLHQHALAGDTCRPLDVGAFVERHVARFTRAYGAHGKRRR